MILRSRAGSNGGRSHRQEKGERTDGESSYSSFCSSFFKTESWASGEEADAAGAQKKVRLIPDPRRKTVIELLVSMKESDKYRFSSIYDSFFVVLS